MAYLLGNRQQNAGWQRTVAVCQHVEKQPVVFTVVPGTVTACSRTGVPINYPPGGSAGIIPPGDPTYRDSPLSYKGKQQ